MTKRLIFIGLIALAFSVWITVVPVSAGPTPAVSIQITNFPAGGVLELGVGESYTFDIQVVSDQPFTNALALVNQHFPGRGIFYHGSDIAVRSTTATLHLTVTGKEPTAGFPNGMVPASANVAVRFGRNVVVQTFNFNVIVS